MKRNLRKPHRVKPYFCYDEDLRFKRLVKKCGGKALFVSVVVVMEKQGAKDPLIIETCNDQDHHIITHNTKDYKDPGQKIKIGIVCNNCSREDSFVKKFQKMLRFYPKHKDYYHRTVLLGKAISVRNRKTGDIRLH